MIGFMGSGKSTLGKQLSEISGLKFIDLDQEIEKLAKQTIDQIFNTQGEAEFRFIEKTCLDRTFLDDNIIVATGGGTPCFFEGIKKMNRFGISVYLNCGKGTLFHRLAKDKKNRPVIKDMKDVDLAERILDLMAKREKYYTKAKIIVEEDDIDANILWGKLNERVKE